MLLSWLSLSLFTSSEKNKKLQLNIMCNSKLSHLKNPKVIPKMAFYYRPKNKRETGIPRDKSYGVLE
jgi:hypothetical protein